MGVQGSPAAEPKATLRSLNESLMMLSVRQDDGSPAGGGASARRGPAAAGSNSAYPVDHIAPLQASIESTTRRLEVERRRLNKLDKELAAAEVEAKQRLQKQKTAGKTPEEDERARKVSEVRKLERRLEKAILELNEGQTQNEALRELIDQLRRERLVLNDSFKHLNRSVASYGQQLGKLVKGTGEEREACETSKQKAAALTKLLDRERRALRRDVEEHQKVLAEVTTTNRSRQLREGSDRFNMSQAQPVAEEEGFSELDMQRRVLKLAFLNALQRRCIKQHQEGIEVFEKAFDTIKSSTGICEVEEIVRIFAALEQSNFSMLTYANQLNSEIEAIEVQNRELRSRFESHQALQDSAAAAKKVALSEAVTQEGRIRESTKEKTSALAALEALQDQCQPTMWRIARLLEREAPRLAQTAYGTNGLAGRAVPSEESSGALTTCLTFIEDALLLFRSALSQDALARLTVASGPHRGSGLCGAWGLASHPTLAASSLTSSTGSLTAPRLTAAATSAALSSGGCGASVLSSGAPPLLPTALLGGAKKPLELPSTPGDESDEDAEPGAADRPLTRTELRTKAQAAIQRRRRKPGGRHAGAGIGAAEEAAAGSAPSVAASPAGSAAAA